MKQSIYSGCTVNHDACDCMSKLTPDEQGMIEKSSVIVSYKKGEIICKQGSFASHVMFMQKGLAKVFLDDGQNSLVLKIIPEGNLLGLT
ncbi:MAG: cyclic nucleotide-binding domain-containing protein, partial [Ignavibacteria bacterium]|nr:cyclic nucleotide-binding domain-containing protein [Ignavibacteria bacterium]